MANDIIETLPTDQFSTYHQERFHAIQTHLLEGPTSTNQFSPNLIEGLKQIWPQPVFFSSTHHAKLDAPPQFVVGGLLYAKFAELVYGQAETFPTIWESHPRGIGTIRLAYPTNRFNTEFSSIPLAEEFPNHTPWRRITSVQEEIDAVLASHNWEAIKSAIKDFFPENRVDQANFAIDKLAGVYTQLSRQNSEDTISDFTNKLLRELSMLVFGNEIVTKLPPTLAYSRSGLLPKINQTFIILDQEIGLEKVFSDIVDEKTAGNLFSGGTNTLIRIGFSVKKSRFQLSEYEVDNPKNKISDRKPISKTEVLDLLDKREVIPTGIPAFAALAAASTVTRVSHLGNEYGSIEQILAGWKNHGIKDLDGYVQATQDFRDCWSPIVAPKPGIGNSVPITMATLYIWKNVFDLECQKLLLDSLKEGQSIVINANQLKNGGLANASL